MKNIDDIHFYELFELEANRILNNNLNIDKKLFFLFGRSFVYGVNLLNKHFNNPESLNHYEKTEVPQIIDLFDKFDFNFNIFKMSKEDLCNKYNIEYYKIS